MIAGIAAGTRLPEQWGVKRADGDFYDLKADVDALLALTAAPATAASSPAHRFLACIRDAARRSCAMAA